MGNLRRIHLQDCDLTSEQAIAIIEILPEIPYLARINIMDNPELSKLANAKSEEMQEEACALYASLLAAARISKSLVCVDIEVPTDEAAEIVKAMAKHVVAYCLRNMELMQDPNIRAALSATISDSHADEGKPADYPDVIAHLVGQDVMADTDIDETDAAPDEDYVIGGTGVVKALTFCLKNRGEESARQSGEFIRETDSGTASPRARIPGASKAKDTSKHLLQGARKIRHRLQPALNKAKNNPSDEINFHKLMFLDSTLEGIIKRFEDEFPDTRETHDQDAAISKPSPDLEELTLTTSLNDDQAAVISDGEDDSAIHPARTLSRSNSILSKTQAEEEGRVHRAGHRFRAGILRKEHIDVFSTIDDISNDPNHVRLLTEMVDEAGGELLQRSKEIGVVAALKEDRESILKSLKEMDPEYFETFLEAQKKAVANIDLREKEKEVVDESAIED